MQRIETTNHTMTTQREYRGSDALQLYLQEMAQTPLLTPQQEIALAKRIQKGDRQARTRMIKANLRLVVKIARDYENLGLPLLDLINEGNLGLMKAVDRFNPRKGAKLSTYAAWWIKQSARRALANQSRTVRLPAHVADAVHRLQQTSLRLTETLGREPTDEELADRLKLPRPKVAQLRSLAQRPTSLETPLSGDHDEDSATLSERVADADALTPYELLRAKTLRQDIRQQIQRLSPREQAVLTLRFGLDGNEPMTLEEVGKKFKVSRERIRQIQDAALRKLRRQLEELETPAHIQLS